MQLVGISVSNLKEISSKEKFLWLNAKSFLIDGSSNIIDVSLSYLGNYLQIFSSNSSMVEHIDNLIKHYPKTWREVFVSNKHENFDDKKHLEKVLK